MKSELPLEHLWSALAPEAGVFQPELVQALAPAAQRYLTHAIAPGTRLANSVRLRMHGELKLRRWLPFTAEQVIRWDKGMIWSASLSFHGLPIRGSDRLVDGQGTLSWKLLGLIPLLQASGPDITRSCTGRLQAEAIWLPSMLCGPQIDWQQTDLRHPHATVPLYGETAQLALTLTETGGVQSAALPRWGNPGGGEFRDEAFGALVEKEGTFHGYTIPTRVRVGWYFGSDRFEPEGEFFRASIDHALFR
jgi:hypothetical protein